MSKVVIIRESVAQSWARDVVTFGSLCAASWFINERAGGSGWLNFTLALVWIIWVLGRAYRHRLEMTPQQARAFLDENYPEAA